jgi:hypothetical protein
MKRAYCQKKFGKTTIFIEKNGSICIAGDWFCNWGIIYPHAIKPFKNGAINPCTGFHIQVIGMDANVFKTHKNWIYDKIRKGYFDHLITE